MIYRFADCIIDVKKHEFYRAGELIEIEPKVFAVLCFLLEKEGEVISRDELLELGWAGAYVSEETLSRCLSRVRKAIGKKSGQIQAVYGKGYRFVGDVEKLDEWPLVSESAAPLEPSTAKPKFASDAVIHTEVPAAITVDPAPPVENIKKTPSVAASLPADESVKPASDSYRPVHATISAEHRQLTVMYCQWNNDIDNASELDIEDLYQWHQDFYQPYLDRINQLGGYVAQQLPNRLVVYFGYPQAQEDSARRALRASLQLLTTKLDATPSAAWRIGIHTGPVIVESAANDANQQPLVIGNIQDIAERLCAAAATNKVVISATTAQLVSSWFEWEQLLLPLQPLASAEPNDKDLTVYQITAEHQQRLFAESEEVVQAKLTPFVGRLAELSLLQDRWFRVQEGAGQVILLNGDAGIGKSRLVAQLKHDIVGEPYIRLECHCSPYHQSTALFPLIELLRRILAAQTVKQSVDELERIETLVQHYQLISSEAVPLLAALLSLPLPHYPAVALSPQQQRQQTLQLLLRLLLIEAQTQPLLLIIEDLHWADPTTLELIERLIQQVPSTPIFIVLTGRPDFQPRWDLDMPVTPLLLDRFNRSQIEQMLWRLSDGKNLPEPIAQQIIEKADGVPLFIEELTRMLLDSGQLRETERGFELSAPLEQLSIPLTLQDSLMERLDKLPTGKLIAQWGAILGRQFSYQWLAAVSGLDEPILQQGLEELLTAGLIYRQGLPPQTRYLFKHALIRDSAYQSMLTRQRQTLHHQVARVLEAQFSQIVTEQPELLAQHYTLAGQASAAIPYWLRAGQKAAERWAHEEAIEHLNHGLELLDSLPDTVERSRQELELRIILGPSLVTIRGPADLSVEQCFERARQVCRQLGESSQLFLVQANLWRFNHSRARHQSARQLGEELLAEAQQQNNPRMQQAAYQALGMSSIFLGNPASGCEYLQNSLSLAEPLEHGAVDARYGHDPQVLSRGFLSIALQFIGYPDQAWENAQRFAEFAETLKHPHNQAQVWHLLVLFYLFRAELPQAQRHAEAMLALAERYQFPHFLTLGKILQGWLLAAQEQQQQGVALMRQGIIDYETVGSAAGLSAYRLLLAEGYAMAKQPSEGLQTLSKAFAMIIQSGERYVEPALYRLQGVLLLQQSQPEIAQAEASLQQALQIARQQQTKWWELRAAISLAQLWRDQGKSEQAYQILAPVYEWFTEGFETTNLREAKQLLQQLQG